MSSTTIERVADLQDASNIFQIKVLKDRGLAKEFLSRCRASGYAALCILVDAPVGGNKERDLEYGMMMPPKISVKSVLGFAARPLWTASYFLGLHGVVQSCGACVQNPRLTNRAGSGFF
jgi:L-lactate dehydrogenase (cytochrome)